MRWTRSPVLNVKDGAHLNKKRLNGSICDKMDYLTPGSGIRFARNCLEIADIAGLYEKGTMSNIYIEGVSRLSYEIKSVSIFNNNMLVYI